MKADIDQDLMLILTAESGAESIALKAWFDEIGLAINKEADCNASIKVELLRSNKPKLGEDSRDPTVT